MTQDIESPASTIGHDGVLWAYGATPGYAKVSARGERLFSSGSRGMAIIEGALWLVVFLPVSFKVLFVLALLHDRSVIEGVPQAVLREVLTEGMRWVLDSQGERYQAPYDNLRRSTALLTQSSVREASSAVFKVDALSSKACFWIYAVDEETGDLKALIASECDSRGEGGRKLSLNRYIEQESFRLSGVPLSKGPKLARFANRVVILGLVVGAQLKDPLTGTHHFIEAGGISFPRQEIVL